MVLAWSQTGHTIDSCQHTKVQQLHLEWSVLVVLEWSPSGLDAKVIQKCSVVREWSFPRAGFDGFSLFKIYIDMLMGKGTPSLLNRKA